MAAPSIKGVLYDLFHKKMIPCNIWYIYFFLENLSNHAWSLLYITYIYGLERNFFKIFPIFMGKNQYNKNETFNFKKYQNSLKTKVPMTP